MLPIENGVAIGSFSLSKNLYDGSYRIRAYTNWMRNFSEAFLFRKDFELVNPLKISGDTLGMNVEARKGIRTNVISDRKKLIVNFFPEGGDLIDGISSKVAVKVIDSFGRGVAFTGSVINNKNELVDEVESNEYGHGVFFMTPSLDSSYSAIINSDTFKLPKVKDQGASIRVVHSYNSDKIYISTLSNGVDLTDGSLIAHQRGVPLFYSKCKQPSSFSIALNKQNLSPGIIHITFITKAGIPLSERLIFPKIPSNSHEITIEPDQEVYKRRSKIKIEFNSLRDSVHSASVTVNPIEDISVLENQETIISYLLLSSDIKGRIESPSYYFNQTNVAYEALDLLMLTQGWSRFNWKSLLDNTDFTLTLLPEKGITISGQVVDYYKEDQPREAILTYVVPKLGIIEPGQTDENGQFMIEGNDFQDATMVIINAHGFKGKKNKEDNNVKVKIDHIPSPSVTLPILSYAKPDSALIKKVNKLEQISKAYMLDEEATLLDEVVVSAKNPAKEKILERTRLYSDPSHRIIMDSLGYNVAGQSAFDLLRMIPGIQISGTLPDVSIKIRGPISMMGNNEPLFVIDGVPVDKDAFNSMPIQSIEFIDVLKGPKATIYGARGTGGVILIYTRHGASGFIVNSDPKGILGFVHPGYSKSKEFYSPQYHQPKDEHAVPDYRSTIFWEPDLKFDDNEQLTFYSSDQKGIYLIQLEGILKNGKPVYESMTIEIE